MVPKSRTNGSPLTVYKIPVSVLAVSLLMMGKLFPVREKRLAHSRVFFKLDSPVK
jgi:hypothetical protein